METLALGKCNASGKTKYISASDAKNAILKIKAKKNSYESTTLKRIKRRNGKSEHWRYYYCKGRAKCSS